MTESALYLPRAFFARDPRYVALELLGKTLVLNDERGQRCATIVETEAYLGPQDQAAHSRRGITERTRLMFGPAGYAYVYLIYGLHHCMNIVSGVEGDGTAVLLRAAQWTSPENGPSLSGPGRLCKGLGIDKAYNGADACAPAMHWLDAPPLPPEQILISPRIGVEYAGAWAKAPLRYSIAQHPEVSVKPGKTTTKRSVKGLKRPA
ncbi:DNA-3-methyladenine glycosylase [Alcaligenes phenolicus]|uniref:DNA-3-methyladenine glycosylase n=1 Tax=Alcaligenes phenolicus TaxID=232846 RepID=UPI00352EBD27